MFKKLYAGAVALAGCTIAAETTEENKNLACVEYPTDWVKFDLRELEKENDDVYFKNGLSFNFCSYLPQTSYFASIQIPPQLHTQILTSDDFVPSAKSAISGLDDKIEGITVTWDAEEEICPAGGSTSFTVKV